MSKAKRPVGNPTKFDLGKAEEICELVSQGKTLTSACKEVGVPRGTFTHWVLDDRDGIAARYARARDMMLECLADSVLDVACDSSRDRTNIPVNRDRLHVDSIKWILSKLRPEKYGESIKVDQRTTLVSVKDTPEELATEKDSWVNTNSPETEH